MWEYVFFLKEVSFCFRDCQMDELYEYFHFGQCFGVSRGTGPWQKLLSCLTAAASAAEKSLGGGRVKAPGVRAEGKRLCLDGGRILWQTEG